LYLIITKLNINILFVTIIKIFKEKIKCIQTHGISNIKFNKFNKNKDITKPYSQDNKNHQQHTVINSYKILDQTLIFIKLNNIINPIKITLIRTPSKNLSFNHMEKAYKVATNNLMKFNLSRSRDCQDLVKNMVT
jgi:hypothetical protein